MAMGSGGGEEEEEEEEGSGGGGEALDRKGGLEGPTQGECVGYSPFPM